MNKYEEKETSRDFNDFLLRVGKKNYWKQHPCYLYYFLLEKNWCLGGISYDLSLWEGATASYYLNISYLIISKKYKRSSPKIKGSMVFWGSVDGTKLWCYLC